MSIKINTTISTDPEVKANFKIECAMNGVEMSETTQQLWQDYIDLSRELREANNKQKNINEQRQ